MQQVSCACWCWHKPMPHMATASPGQHAADALLRMLHRSSERTQLVAQAANIVAQYMRKQRICETTDPSTCTSMHTSSACNQQHEARTLHAQCAAGVSISSSGCATG